MIRLCRLFLVVFLLSLMCSGTASSGVLPAVNPEHVRLAHKPTPEWAKKDAGHVSVKQKLQRLFQHKRYAEAPADQPSAGPNE